MSTERFLVTGAFGCIGAYVVRQLVRDGAAVTTLDLGTDPHRWRQVMAPGEIQAVNQIRGDVTDLESLERVLDAEQTNRIIHLAALQVPFCRADPPLGARVNVVGTVNIFEAAKRRADRIGPVVYASSIGAYDAIDADNPVAAMVGHPSTLYGVFKRANEGTAAVYWADDGVASVGIRPHTVFGPGRDQGLTSAPTTAMLAAAAGRPFRISFGGRLQLQYVPDVAGAFVAAARADVVGAAVHNLAGVNAYMSEVLAAVDSAAPGSSGLISFEDVQLPFPTDVDAASFEAAIGAVPETPLRDAVAETVETFRRLIAEDLIDLSGLAG